MLRSTSTLVTTPFVERCDNPGESHLILPDDFAWPDVLAVQHVLDRGSVGRCAVWYGGTRGNMLWSWRWGQNHDDWNAVKAAAHDVEGGRIWSAIVKFSGVMNIHVGPFKSGAWGRQLQEIHHKLKSGLLDPTSDQFNAVAQKQFELDGLAYDGFDHGNWVDNYWERFCNLRLILVFLFIVKFARWGSIDDAWGWARSDIWLAKPVYEALRDERKVGEADTTGLGTAQYDTEAGAASAPKGGLVERAARNITDELCLCMDIYSVVSAPVRDRQSRRAKDRKTVAKASSTNSTSCRAAGRARIRRSLGGSLQGARVCVRGMTIAGSH